MTLNRNALIGLGLVVLSVVVGVFAWGSSAGEAAECPCDLCPCAADAAVEADAGVPASAEAITTETTETTLVPAALSTETAATTETTTETTETTTESTTTTTVPTTTN